MKQSPEKGTEDTLLQTIESSSFTLKHAETKHLALRYLEENDKIIKDTIESLREHDTESYEHSVRVFLIAIDMGLDFRLSPSELQILGLAALLHDIGKREIDKTLLRKPGKLDPQERETMKSHVRHTVKMLGEPQCAGVPNIEAVRVIAGSHHKYEKQDPYSGFLDNESPTTEYNPEVLEKIKQILVASDVFEALSSKRAYRDGFPRQKVETIMREELRIQPELIDRVLERFPN